MTVRKGEVRQLSVGSKGIEIGSILEQSMLQNVEYRKLTKEHTRSIAEGQKKSLSQFPSYYWKSHNRIMRDACHSMINTSPLSKHNRQLLIISNRSPLPPQHVA